MVPVVRKMPDPMTLPMTSIVAPQSPMPRTSLASAAVVATVAAEDGNGGALAGVDMVAAEHTCSSGGRGRSNSRRRRPRHPQLTVPRR
jgi:hypothetical protein